MRLKVFDEALEMLRMPLGTILARRTLLKFFPGDVANAASHDSGARNAIVKFSTILVGDVANVASHDIGAKFANEIISTTQAVRFPLVTVLAREPRLKVFDEAVEMVRVPLVTILAREPRLRFFKLSRCCECR